MGGSGEVLGLMPPIHDSLNGEQGRAPEDQNRKRRDITDHGAEHGGAPLVGCCWLVVEFAGRFAWRARRAACSETMRRMAR